MGGKQRQKKYKKINVTDVEEAHEDERMVQKYKKQGTIDNALFSIDTVGGTKGMPKSVRVALKREKQPRGFASMSKDSLLQIDKMIDKLQRPKPKLKPQKPSVYDIWDAPSEAKVKRPATVGEKTCKAPAVIVADPGQAVNPDSKFREELIFKAAATKLVEENLEKDMTRRLKPMTAKLADEFGPEQIGKWSQVQRVEKFQELVNPGVDIEVEGAVPRKTDRKTTHQKNKRQRHESTLRHLSKVKKQKLFHKSISQVPTLLKELKAEEEQRGKEKEYLDALKKKSAEEEAKGVIEKPIRLGRLRFKEAPIDVPQENGTLRSVKPTVIVSDRINSFYRRNLLEHRSENTSLTLRRMKHQSRKNIKNKKLASSLQRSLLLS